MAPMVSSMAWRVSWAFFTASLAIPAAPWAFWAFVWTDVVSSSKEADCCWAPSAICWDDVVISAVDAAIWSAEILTLTTISERLLTIILMLLARLPISSWFLTAIVLVRSPWAISRKLTIRSCIGLRMIFSTNRLSKTRKIKFNNRIWIRPAQTMFAISLLRKLSS